VDRWAEKLGLDLGTEYRSWKPRELLNPLTGDAEEIIEGLLEIIEAEGPMTRRRAFRIYTRASGSRLRDTVVPVLNHALTRALRRRKIEQRNESGSRDPLDHVVRIAGTPPVAIRRRGDRALEDIPAAEITALAELVREKEPGLTDAHALRAIQNHYGIGRLTERARDALAAAVSHRLDFGKKIHVV
jgi:hypothetical protein